MAKSRRNSNAGKFTGTSASSKYFATHPEARAKKNEYNKKYHATEERKNYREDLNRANRAADAYGDNRDMSHTKSGKLTQENRSTNRARNGKGDNKRLR